MSTDTEEFYCLGDECPDKRCDLCRCKHTIMLDPTDSYRTGRGVSSSGYYSSNGIVQVVGPDGKVHYNYARNPIDYYSSN